jgi:hypothetical protein
MNEGVEFRVQPKTVTQATRSGKTFEKWWPAYHFQQSSSPVLPPIAILGVSPAPFIARLLSAKPNR